jgi:hypothetical protein
MLQIESSAVLWKCICSHLGYMIPWTYIFIWNSCFTKTHKTLGATNDRMNEWMDEWMNDWLNEWMNEWMNEWLIDWLIEWMNVNECKIIIKVKWPTTKKRKKEKNHKNSSITSAGAVFRATIWRGCRWFESRCGTCGPVLRTRPFKSRSSVATGVARKIILTGKSHKCYTQVTICWPVIGNGDSHQIAEKLLSRLQSNKA